MKYFYRNLKDKLWGKFGFKDAFNLTYSSNGVSGEWFSDGYLAIDQGPIICMIENYRSQLLWNLFMNDPDIKKIFNSIFICNKKGIDFCSNMKTSHIRFCKFNF